MSKHVREKELHACPQGDPQCSLPDEMHALKQENASLEKLIRTDPLTGLYNYRYFIETLERELERTKRTFQPTTLLMVDLDFFKKVNDNWGHEAGNQVLKMAAAEMHSRVRISDIVCRYGGEEFAVILPSTPLDVAICSAERIREGIAEQVVKLEGGTLSVTASIGAYMASANEILTPELLVEKADGFLYQAKEEGRNRVCAPSQERKIISESAVSGDEKAALFGLLSS